MRRLCDPWDQYYCTTQIYFIKDSGARDTLTDVCGYQFLRYILSRATMSGRGA